MKLLPCHCGRIPAIKAPDVCEDQIYQAQCKCGANSNWWTNRDKCIEEWNKKHGKSAQPTHAMTVLARKKGELAYAG
jgi:murein endopeptidase